MKTVIFILGVTLVLGKPKLNKRPQCFGINTQSEFSIILIKSIGFLFLTGANAAVSNSGEVDGFVSQEEFDQLFNDVMSSNFGFDPKCKLCDEVMRKVRKEVGRESSRVRIYSHHFIHL